MELYHANGLAHAGPLVSSPKTVDLADEVNRPHRLFCENAQASRESRETAITHAIKCGQLLMERKTQLRHGAFQDWVERRCEFKVSTARLYMNAAKQNAHGVSVSSLRHVFQSGRPEARREKRAAKKTAASPATNLQLGAIEDDDRKNRETLREFATRWAARRGAAAIADELTDLAHWLVENQAPTVAAGGPHRVVYFNNGERWVPGVASDVVNNSVRVCFLDKHTVRVKTLPKTDARTFRNIDENCQEFCRGLLAPKDKLGFARTITKAAQAFLERGVERQEVQP